MAGWGALIGLGQGLQDSAQMWNEAEKSKLANKLAQEREQRQADRDLAKEQRQEAARLRQVDNRLTTVDLDPTTGAMTRTFYNSENTPLSTVAVSQMEQEAIQRQRESDRAKLEAQGLEAQLKQLQVERMPQKWAQEDAMHRARLGSESALQAQRYASAAASNRRGLERLVEEEAPVSREQYASALVKDYKNDFDRAEVPASERDGLALMAVQRAAIDNKSPAAAMLEILREYRAGAPRQGASGSRKQGTLLGN